MVIRISAFVTKLMPDEELIATAPALHYKDSEKVQTQQMSLR